MLERVPAEFLEFSPQHLEDLVKFAYFGGFIGLGEARQLLLLPKDAMKPRCASGMRKSGKKAAGSVDLAESLL